MKKLFLFFVYMLSICTLYAQTANLKYLKLHEGGGRSLMTDEMQIAEKGQLTLNVALMYESKINDLGKTPGYSLILSFLSERQDWYVPFEGKLLLKTSSGKVISLSQNAEDGMSGYSPETGYFDNMYRRSSYFTSVSGTTYYTKFGKYPISLDELNTIFDEGIIKIRIETTGSYVECVYPVSEKVKVGNNRSERNLFAATISALYVELTKNIDPHFRF